MNRHQRHRPRIEMIESDREQTLLIDGGQAMQAWETDLMHRSADCSADTAHVSSKSAWDSASPHCGSPAPRRPRVTPWSRSTRE